MLVALYFNVIAEIWAIRSVSVVYKCRNDCELWNPDCVFLVNTNKNTWFYQNVCWHYNILEVDQVI